MGRTNHLTFGAWPSESRVHSRPSPEGVEICPRGVAPPSLADFTAEERWRTVAKNGVRGLGSSDAFAILMVVVAAIAIGFVASVSGLAGSSERLEEPALGPVTTQPFVPETPVANDVPAQRSLERASAITPEASDRSTPTTGVASTAAPVPPPNPRRNHQRGRHRQRLELHRHQPILRPRLHPRPPHPQPPHPQPPHPQPPHPQPRQLS